MNRRFLVNILFSLFIFFTIVFSVSCMNKDEISTDPAYKLSFSTDTVIFDTIFSTIGSITKSLKVHNTNDKKVKISEIQLAKGQNSQYQLNIDGTPSSTVKDIEIAAGDSLFILIKVTIDPTQQNSPLIVSDSIMFFTNGNIQDIDLVAWGQDAHFIVGNKTIEGLRYPYTIIAGEGETVAWEDDKPYVIYGWAVIDSTGVLNVGPGCDIHFHQNSGLWVYKGGSIHVNGEKDSLVTFQGDRLEYDYRELPGQWDRIWINEGSVNNEFNYAVIKNGYIGIQLELTGEDMGNTLVLNNTIIENMSRWGLFTIASRVVAANCVFANCAENTLFLSVGGQYDFRHCTFADYWNLTIRQDPSFIVSNHLVVQNPEGGLQILQGDLVKAYFGNCIVYGNVEEEIILAKEEGTQFNYDFKNCLLKTTIDIANDPYFVDCIKNDDPLFIDYFVNNYRLDTLSPAIDYGSINVVDSALIDVEFDLDGNSRISDIAPDAGAYEFVPL